MFLTVYVDDFKMSGPPMACKGAWELIRTDLRIEDPTPVDHYLGCKHIPFEKKVDKIIVRGVEYDMSSFFKSCVESTSYWLRN